MGQSPPGKTCNATGVGTPLLNGPTEFGPHHPTPVQFTTGARKTASAGDLLFCVRGSTTGRMNWADRDYAIGRGVAAIRHKRHRRLQPLVRGIVERNLPELLAQATGSTFPNVNARHLANIPWPALDLPAQRAIAHILGTLDDKIELNRRNNETLEAMARALFKSWFVDFEPVRAKMEGRADGLPQSVAALFPDEIAGKHVQEAPVGWNAYSLADIAVHHTSTVSPSATPEKPFEHYSIPAHDAGQTPTMQLGMGIKSNKTLVPDDAVLLSKLNPHIPRVWAPSNPKGALQVCSTEFLAFSPSALGSRSLLFSLFSDGRFRTMLRSLVTGTSKSHQRVPPKSLKTQFAIAGTPGAFRTFDRLARPWLDRVITNRVESQSLARIRDLLLPKLVSGAIPIPQAERVVEAATEGADA